MNIHQKLRAIRKLIDKRGVGVLYRNYEYFKKSKEGKWFLLAYTQPTQIKRKLKLFLRPDQLE